MVEAMWRVSAISLAALLAACGGGGGSGVSTSSSSTPTAVLSGVVAVGAALPSVVVSVVDANGLEATAETAADGSYQVFDPSGRTLVAPFKVKVKTLLGSTEVSLDSFALARGATSNVTPLSTAVMALINSSGGYNASTLAVSSITPAQVTDANTKLATALASVMSAANVSASDFNPVSGTFTANNQGIDSVMDRVSVDPTSSGIALTNRFVLLTEGQMSPAPVMVTSAGASTALPPGITPPGADTLARFVAKLNKCFSVSASSRVSYTVNAAGRSIYTANTLHQDCAVLADSVYRSQGQLFGQKWLHFLSNADFDNTTKFVLVPQYVVDRSASPSWPGDKKAYVYNINLIDKNKFTYTMPEVMAKVDDDFVMYGNQRKFDISVQPMFSKLSDNAGSFNSVEGRLRIGIDPTLVPNSSGIGTYHYTANGLKPLPKILCAWVTGPLLQKDEVHDPDAPKGGILMVPSHSELTARRDYSAVRIKYPTDFDPVNNATHRTRLYNDCKATHTVGSVAEVASAETNSAFTIDAVKTNASSSSTFAAYSSLNAPVAYPTSLTRFACPTFNASGSQTNVAATGNVATTASTVSGWCNSTRRESMVTTALRSAAESRYQDPKDLQYTFYVFVDSAYSESTANAAYSTFANADAFFASAEKANVRVVGKLPFLDKTITSGVEVYNGTEQFRGVGSSMISAYLASGASTLTGGSQISASWTIPTGAEGIDRLGIGGWFRKSDGTRIGAATFSDSFGLPRSSTSSAFTLSEDWYGYDRSTYRSGMFAATPYLATSTYREIWVRSYDRYNRQIQTVEFAVR
jgi:hypothetical protein